MRKRTLKLTSLILIIAGVVAFASIVVSQGSREKQDELYRNIDLFSDTFAIIQSDYVEEVESKTLVYGALKGMLLSLDAHSQFMDPDTYNELKVDTTGQFGGLGPSGPIQLEDIGRARIGGAAVSQRGADYGHVAGSGDRDREAKLVTRCRIISIQSGLLAPIGALLCKDVRCSGNAGQVAV